MTRWSVFTKLSLTIGMVLFVLIYLYNSLISQEFQQHIEILSANSANAFPLNNIKLISSIFLTLGVMAPAIVIKIITATVTEKTRALASTLEKNESTDAARFHAQRPASFDLALKTSKVLHENILNSERLIQLNIKATTQSALLTASLRELNKTLEEKLKILIETVGGTQQSESLRQQSITFQLTELMHLASQLQAKTNDTIKTLASLKSFTDEQTENLRRQFEILGTTKSLQKKSTGADVDLTSIIEKLYSDFQITNPFLKYITVEILGIKPESIQKPLLKTSSVTTGGESPVTGKHKQQLTSNKDSTSPSTAKKAAPQKSPIDQQKIHNKTREKFDVVPNKPQTAEIKSNTTEPIPKILDLNVEEKKIPVRTDARFEDL